jgi:hypothetical protein
VLDVLGNTKPVLSYSGDTVRASRERAYERASESLQH